MNERETVVNRGSVELIVLGLLAALVVALAFPMLNRLEKKRPSVPADAQQQADAVDEFPVD